MMREPDEKSDQSRLTVLEKITLTVAVAIVGIVVINVGGVFLEVYSQN